MRGDFFEDGGSSSKKGGILRFCGSEKNNPRFSIWVRKKEEPPVSHRLGWKSEKHPLRILLPTPTPTNPHQILSGLLRSLCSDRSPTSKISLKMDWRSALIQNATYTILLFLFTEYIYCYMCIRTRSFSGCRTNSQPNRHRDALANSISINECCAVQCETTIPLSQ